LKNHEYEFILLPKNKLLKDLSKAMKGYPFYSKEKKCGNAKTVKVILFMP
jgi:hypothetical protein